MTDPIADEAVEAAARAYLRGDRMGVGENSGRHRSGILSALAAAAPHIAAQATADLHERIEALRDEWRAVHDEYQDAAGLGVRGAVATVYAMNADALDALLRERAR